VSRAEGGAQTEGGGNRVLRGMCGGEEVTRAWRQFLNEELHVYPPPGIVMIKLKMKWGTGD
jgi:hypothetical protein